MRATRLFLFDLDGTIYLSGTLLAGATGFLDRLDAAGVPYAFMTNNSSLGPGDYLQKLRRLGLRVEAKGVLTSAEASVLMLRELGLGPGLYVLGSAAYKAYLTGQGYTLTDERPAAVLVGFDQDLTYAALAAAARLVWKGAPLLASHPDVYCPSAAGLCPDAGAIVAALEAATGKKVQAIAGKPHRWIVQLARQRFDVDCDEICVVGDRLQTDIRMGKEMGMRTVLPLTGATGREDLAGWRPDLQPDLVVEAVADLAGKYWPTVQGWLDGR